MPVTVSNSPNHPTSLYDADNGRIVPVDTADRFWAKVNKYSGTFVRVDGLLSECWEWTACKNDLGYGRMYGLKKRSAKAHRVGWELVHGSIEVGKCVLHKCDNPSCVRPDHLYVGTLLDNGADCSKRGRTGSGKKTHCKYGHEFNEENTRVRRNGDRICRTCHMLATRVRRQRKRKVVET